MALSCQTLELIRPELRMENNKTAELRVFRYNPDLEVSGYYDAFSVPCGPHDQLLDILIRLKESVDPSLSFRSSCRHGICGSCAVRVNNKPLLACKSSMFSLIEEFGPALTVDPLDPQSVEKDLIIDKSDFWEKYDRVEPYTIQLSDFDSFMKPEILAAIADADHCIQCSICYYVCPVIKILPEFLGPAAFTKVYRFAFDPRDDSEARIRLISRQGEGVWDCIKCLQCTEACPKHVDPFSKITRLHELGIKENAGVGKESIRHVRAFRQALGRAGLINEALLGWQTLRLAMVRLVPRGILMFFKGKLHINPFFPRSRRLDEVKSLLKRKKG